MTHPAQSSEGAWLSATLLGCVLGCGQRPATVPNESPVGASAVEPAPNTPLASVPALTYRPPAPGPDDPKTVTLAPFQLEAHAVTNAQYLDFVRAEPAWQRQRVRAVFADAGYLQHWPGDLEIATSDRNLPVVNVSWFSARAYAAWRGRRLATQAEWEAVAAVGLVALDGSTEPGTMKRILDWYSKPGGAPLQAVRSTPPNCLGVYDLHGLVWEWVEDFNSALLTDDARGGGGKDNSLFCGSGALGAANPSDYAAFMRQAFRGGLRARYTVRNLGFRCAADPVRTH